MTNSRRRGSGRKSIITKDMGLKIENLIKEHDLLDFEDITKILVETASDKWRQLMSVMSLSGGKI